MRWLRREASRSYLVETCRERSGQESAEAIVVEEMSRGRDARVNNDTGELTQRRAELRGNVLTAWRTVNPPMTPDGEVEPRVAAMGSMWAFRSRLRLVLYAGLSRVRAEPPCTMPRRDSGSSNREATPHGRSQTRKHGGVGPVTCSLSQSRGPDSAT